MGLPFLKLYGDYLSVEGRLSFEKAFGVKRVVEIEVCVVQMMTEFVKYRPDE